MTRFRGLDLDAVPSEKLETIAQGLQGVAGVCLVLWLGTDVLSRILAPVSYTAEALVPPGWVTAAAITIIGSLGLSSRQLWCYIDRRAERRP